MDETGVGRRPWQLEAAGRQWFDRVLATVLLLPSLAMPVAGVDPRWIVLSVVQVLPLYWRRTHPVAVFVAVAVAHAVQVPLLGTPIWGQVAFPVAVYSVARFSTAGPALAAMATGVVAGAVASVDWLVGFFAPEVTVQRLLPYFLTCSAFVVTAWALGTLGRTRAAYVDTLVERAERIRFEAEQQVALAASDERARIAREMHDVVAHGLSVIVVQADGARYAAAQDPSLATEVLGTIASIGRESLTEMRRMLGLLRADDTGTAPAPRLTDLPILIEQAGECVRAELHGLETEVPVGVALTTYRVVQEALSNVRKHAGPDVQALVRVQVTDTEVSVQVDDDGRGAAADNDGSGLGLLGMRERVAVHGGTITTGPRPGGGFRVDARIPL
ncbi:sensor histidine kinase [Nocardioides sp. InS609-2]|uniref:sensor histidine kinase n=1 Tax=Nocardioides sp. InS609-2 TaxID=2760705 RepID=UPI0020C09246|nr:sensor histidine kinase [Nocardioides sp. InS609-2]